jgi:ankyrin repeat protein
MNLSFDNQEQSVIAFLDSPWASTPAWIPSLIHNLFLTAIYRPYTSALTARFASAIASSFPPSFEFKSRIVQALIARFAARSYTPLRGALCHFLAHCVAQGFLCVPEVVEPVAALASDAERFEPIAFNLFVWLAPELEKEAPAFFETCESIVGRMARTDGHYPTVQRFLVDLPKLRENDWCGLKQRRFSDRTLRIFSAIFKRNEIEALLQLSVHPAFNIDQKIALSIYEPSFFVSNGPSMIEFAAFCGAIDCVEFFLENQADTSRTDNSGLTLCDFIMAGGFPDVLALYRQFDPDFVPGSAHLLAQFHHPDPPITSKSLIAATISNNIEVVSECLKSGIDPNSVNEKAQTPLIIGCLYGHVDLVTFLLAIPNIAINAQDSDGFTALQYASQNGFEEICQILVSQRGIDPTLAQRFGMTALHWAAQKGFHGIVRALLALSQINVNATDDENWTPLHWAARNGYTDVADLLLTVQGIDLNPRQQVFFKLLME